MSAAKRAKRPAASSEPPKEEARDGCEIEQAVYCRTVIGLEPTLFCSCGYAAQGADWEEAGQDYDAHLNGNG